MKKMVKPDKPRRKKAEIMQPALTLPELTAQIAELGIATNQRKSASGKPDPSSARPPPPRAPYDPTYKSIVERAFAPIARKLLDAGSK